MTTRPPGHLGSVPRRVITPTPGGASELARSLWAGELLAGPQVQRFEQTFAARLQRAECVAMCSGRLALVATLDALDRPGRNEVIFPAYTMESLPVLVRAAGYLPVFVDVDPTTFQMDPAAVKSALTPRTRAVVATHLFGTACPIDSIRASATAAGAALIEDCAHALGATLNDQPLGTWGRAAFFSFEIAKHINTFGSAAVVADHEPLLTTLRQRVNAEAPGWRRAAQLATKMAATYAERALSHPVPYALLVARGLDRPNHNGGGLIRAYKRIKGAVRATSLSYTNYQARLALRQLAALDWSIDNRRRAALQLEQRLQGLALPQATLPGANRTFYMHIVRVPDAQRAAQRLRAQGVDCGFGAELMQHCARQANPQDDRFPGTDRVLQTALQLPLHPRATRRQQRQLDHTVHRVLSAL